jgi:anthranilate synthase, component I (EC 4.1.3.27)
MYYFNFGDYQIVGSSPESLVRVEGTTVETCPIAGTRPRGHTPEQDAALEADLLTDPKERAEHVMLVDLGRNDVGKVSRYGTVKVEDLMHVEKYSHVMHIVTNVKGQMKEGADAFDALVACLPAGTVSGAPKVRAMQIIDELENVRRGPYAGALGYIGYNGNMDVCITIRTAIFKNGKAYVQAGAGIVADSVPEREYVETANKAKALLQAIKSIEKRGALMR